MKKTLSILFILILVLVFTAMDNNTPRVIISNLSKVGEINPGELRYQINLFGVLPVGEAIFALERQEEYKGRQVYHLSATANSLRWFAKMFNAYATLDSYIDINSHDPILFRQKAVITNEKVINKEVYYDQKNGIMTLNNIRRQILPNTQDPLSAVFNVRRMDFDKSKDFEMNINTNQKNYILKAVALSKDISVHKKIYKMAFLRAGISRRDENPYHQSNISMVLLKEGGNIPILIKVFTMGILINAKLIDIK